MNLSLHAYSVLAVLGMHSTAQAWTPEKTANCAKPAGMSTLFSKCTARPNVSAPVATSNAYCLPYNGNSGDIPNASLELKTGNSYATLSIAVRNCRTRANTVQGDFVIAIDNSQSACNIGGSSGTDCGKHRLNFAQTLAAELSSGGSNNVGVVAYGGRQTVTFSPATYSNDPVNQIDPDATKIPCLNKATATSNRWAANASGSYESVCEYKSLATSSDLGNINTYIDTTGTIPRGSTDYTYILEAIKNSDLLGGSTKSSKHAIFLTDGLPSIPKRIPRAICELSTILMSPITASGGSFYKESTSPFREYCYDRQFAEAVNQANGYTDGLIDFDGSTATTVAPRFSDINVHNVLYISNGLAYADFDYSTRQQVFPDDVLIENSARTGNGRVKFDYIHGSGTDLTSAEMEFISKLKEAADSTAVQRVTIVIGGKTYHAISSAGFNETFDIKIPALSGGTTTAQITTYYADNTTGTKTITITTNNSSSYTSSACADMSSDLTIDGDSPTNTTPEGDGVLPYTDSSNGMCRVYRNSSDYRRNYALFYQQQYGETQREKAARLHIQGGTGNCGSIVGANSVTSLLAQLMVLLPGLFAAAKIWRRK